MNLSELQSQVAEWANRNFPDAKPYQPLLGVGEETGELMHAHLKCEQSIRVNEDYDMDKMDAVGDIVIFLAHYCQLNGISLDDAVKRTWGFVRQRDWKKHKATGLEVAK